MLSPVWISGYSLLVLFYLAVNLGLFVAYNGFLYLTVMRMGKGFAFRNLKGFLEFKSYEDFPLVFKFLKVFSIFWVLPMWVSLKVEFKILDLFLSSDSERDTEVSGSRNVVEQDEEEVKQVDEQESENQKPSDKFVEEKKEEKEEEDEQENGESEKPADEEVTEIKKSNNSRDSLKPYNHDKRIKEDIDD